MKFFYTAQKFNPGTGELTGPVHKSIDGENSLCGIKFFKCPPTKFEDWSILNNTFNETVTCKHCLTKNLNNHRKVSITEEEYKNLINMFD